MLRFPLVLACCCLAVAVLLAPAAAQATAPADAIALLNQQRAASGIPGDVVESPGLDDGCAKHAAYIAQNGGALVNGEDPSKPGYTPEGDGQTLESSGPQVLSSDATWSDTANPWDLMPIHLYRILDPNVTSAGYDDAHGIACMRVGGARAPATAPELYSVPASGSTGIAFSQLNHETPYTPAQLAGLPADQATGPNILLFTRGLRGSAPLGASSFSLTGPSGPVDARLVTEGTTNAVGTGSWFRGGGVMVPAAPLAPFATYTAHVMWHRDADATLPAADVDQAVTFETAGLANTIDVSIASNADVNTIHVTTPAPNPALTTTGPGQLTDVPTLVGGSITYTALEPGPWTACARSGGKAVGYVPASICKPFTASAKVLLAFSHDRGRAFVALLVPSIARGRMAQVTVSRTKSTCTGKGTRQKCVDKTVGHADRSTVALVSPRMRIKAPRRKPGEKVTARVQLPAFTIGDAPYLAADVSRSWK